LVDSMLNTSLNRPFLNTISTLTIGADLFVLHIYDRQLEFPPSIKHLFVFGVAHVDHPLRQFANRVAEYCFHRSLVERITWHNDDTKWSVFNVCGIDLDTQRVGIEPLILCQMLTEEEEHARMDEEEEEDEKYLAKQERELES
jgi:hypothetical protein